MQCAQVSLVGQEPVLYARTIADNVAYGLKDEEFTRESVTECAKMANAHSFISSLPSAYETEVGEKGVQMSGTNWKNESF